MCVRNGLKQFMNQRSLYKSMSDNKISPDHYAKYNIEPIHFIRANKLDYCQGNIIKYIMRYKDKNGLEDLYKAEWYIKELIKQNQ